MAKLITAFALLKILVCPSLLAASSQRIITTSPSLTELVYQLNGQKKLVATVEYSFYPEAAKSLPTIGTFFSPSIEATLSYQPDLVLIDAAARNAQYEQALTRLGIKTELISIDSVESLYVAASRLETILESTVVTKKLVSAKLEKKYSYVGLVWTSPSIVLTDKTFLSSLIKTTGGINLADFRSEQPYLTVSDEWLMVSKPDVVFLLHEYEMQKENFKAFCRKIWPHHNPKIVFLPSKQFARTTFTALEGVNQITEQLQ